MTKLELVQHVYHRLIRLRMSDIQDFDLYMLAVILREKRPFLPKLQVSPRMRLSLYEDFDSIKEMRAATNQTLKNNKAEALRVLHLMINKERKAKELEPMTIKRFWLC